MALPIASLQIYSDANLISQWAFDGNSTDGKGAHNGTDTSMSYTATGAKYGQKATVAGSPSYIETTVLTTGSNAFSMGGWYKTTDAGVGVLLAWGNVAVGDASFAIVQGQVAAGKLRISDPNSGDGAVIALQTNNDGNWHHCVATYAGGASGITELWIDGVSQGTSTITLNVGAGAARFGYRNDGTWALVGDLDDWFYFNRKLTNTEIVNIFNGVNPQAGTLLASDI